MFATHYPIAFVVIRDTFTFLPFAFTVFKKVVFCFKPLDNLHLIEKPKYIPGVKCLTVKL